MTGQVAVDELEWWLQEVVIDHPGLERAELVEAVRHADPLLDTATVDMLVDRVRGRSHAGGLAALQPLFDDEARCGPSATCRRRGSGQRVTVTVAYAASTRVPIVGRLVGDLRLQAEVTTRIE